MQINSSLNSLFLFRQRFVLCYEYIQRAGRRDGLGWIVENGGRDVTVPNNYLYDMCVKVLSWVRAGCDVLSVAYQLSVYVLPTAGWKTPFSQSQTGQVTNYPHTDWSQQCWRQWCRHPKVKGGAAAHHSPTRLPPPLLVRVRLWVVSNVSSWWVMWHPACSREVNGMVTPTEVGWGEVVDCCTST